MRGRAGGGFTLTELVTTLSLIGILSAVAAPRFFSLREFSGSFFFDETLSGLRYAHSLAVATGCEVQVDFTTSSWVARQRAGCDLGTFSAEVLDPVSGSPGFRGSAPEGVPVGSSVDPIIFDALGRVLDTSGAIRDVVVTVDARSIEISGESGFLREP